MNEKINLVELLKDCPKGMELDCTMWDNVQLKAVRDGNIYPIEIQTPDGIISLTKNGCYSRNLYGKCVIFPKGKTTWEGFQRPFKDGDIVFYNDTISIFKEWGDETLFRAYACTYLCIDVLDTDVPLFGKSIKKEIRLATKEEKQKLFKAIKDNGYKWNAETKTLEKLIKTKFKVGDRIKHRLTGDVYRVLFVQSNGYSGEVYYHVGVTDKIGKSIDIKEQDNYELVPNKFDITTLMPFDKVLVRQNNNGKWGIDFFGFYTEGFYYTTGSAMYVQCVPYKDNEQLRGTTNDCDEYFKTWE